MTNADLATVERAWAQLEKRAGSLEVTDPQRAIALYQQFFEKGAYRFPAVAIRISSRIAGIYRVDLKNPEKAQRFAFEHGLEIPSAALDRARAVLGGPPGSP